MDALEGLQKAFRDDEQTERFEKERKLMTEVVKYTCTKKGLNPIQGYDPQDVIEFLSKPIPEIKKLLNYDMDEIELRNLVYSLAPKVKKFGNFMT